MPVWQAAAAAVVLVLMIQLGGERVYLALARLKGLSLQILPCTIVLYIPYGTLREILPFSFTKARIRYRGDLI